MSTHYLAFRSIGKISRALWVFSKHVDFSLIFHHARGQAQGAEND